MYQAVKRLFDILLSAFMIIILLPLFAILALFTGIASKGAPFFTHERIGKNGKNIHIFKFRTMVVNAEAMIKDFTPEQREEWEKNFKLKNDPRVTGIGKFLRKTSLDELPQLFNILFGDLSFVGPRPVIEEELEWYGDNKDKFLSVTPGLTGWWACSGRSQIGYPERCDYELYYVDHASILLDLKVIFKTFAVVISHDGAV